MSSFIVKFYVPFHFNLPYTISVHETASRFSTLNDIMQRRLQQMMFEAAFHGYTEALEMLLSQFGVPVNSEDQRVSGWLNCFCMFTPTLSIFLFLEVGEGGGDYKHSSMSIYSSYNCLIVTVCKCVVCYIWNLEQPILPQLLSRYKLNQEMYKMLTEKRLC